MRHGRAARRGPWTPRRTGRSRIGRWAMDGNVDRLGSGRVVVLHASTGTHVLGRHARAFPGSRRKLPHAGLTFTLAVTLGGYADTDSTRIRLHPVLLRLPERDTRC